MVVGLVDRAILVHAEHRLKACLLHLLDNMLVAERQNLYRQAEVADLVNQLGAVADPDVVLCAGCDNLLTEQRAAAALDAVELRVNFVNTVDADIQHRCVVGVQQLDAEALCLLRGCIRRGNALDVQAFLFDALTELFNQIICRRTGADADQHAVLDIFCSFVACHLLFIHFAHLINIQ